MIERASCLSNSSYENELTGKIKPLVLIKCLMSLVDLFGREIREPSIFSSSIVPLGAILTKPFFAA